MEQKIYYMLLEWISFDMYQMTCHLAVWCSSVRVFAHHLVELSVLIHWWPRVGPDQEYQQSCSTMPHVRPWYPLVNIQKKTMENRKSPCSIWVNQLFNYGHFQVRNSCQFTRGYIMKPWPKSDFTNFLWWPRYTGDSRYKIKKNGTHLIAPKQRCVTTQEIKWTRRHCVSIFWFLLGKYFSLGWCDISLLSWSNPHHLLV